MNYEKELADKINEVKTITSNYTILNEDICLGTDSGGGSFEITLELSPVNGREISIVDYVGGCGSNVVTINGNGSLINGETDAVMNINNIGYELKFNGTNWNLK